MDGGTLDGMVEQTGAMFEPSSCYPRRSRKRPPPKRIWPSCSIICGVVARSSELSIITGGGKWVEIKIHADPLYQHLLLTAEKKFWRCVQSGETPLLFNIETPPPRLEAFGLVNCLGRVRGNLSPPKDAQGEHELSRLSI